jgi:hypothetical protein
VVSRQFVKRVQNPVRARRPLRELNPKPRAVRLLEYVHVVLGAEDVNAEPLQFLDGIVRRLDPDLVQHGFSEFFACNRHTRF